MALVPPPAGLSCSRSADPFAPVGFPRYLSFCGIWFYRVEYKKREEASQGKTLVLLANPYFVTS
jgi:hypothetical protein